MKAGKLRAVGLVRTAILLPIFVAGPAAAKLEAGRITLENAAQRIQQGPDATGGIDDWYLSNGTLCAVISDVPHESEFSDRGGVLIDLGFCDRADDHYTHSQDLLGSSNRPLDAQSISAKANADSASVVVQSSNRGVHMQTTYTLDRDIPTRLRISKSLTLDESADNDFNYLTPFWFNYKSLEPFVFSSRDLGRNHGFNNEDFVNRGAKSMRAAAHNADTLVLPSPPDAEAPIAYGWHLSSATRTSGAETYPLPAFVLADNQSNAFFVLADSFYIGDGSQIGLLQLLQIPLLKIQPDDSLLIEEQLYVGNRADVASITDQLMTGGVMVTGRLPSPASALHIELPDGTPVTFIRPQDDGRFSVKLPAGDYQWRLRGSANRVHSGVFKVARDTHDLGLLSLPKAARVNLPRGAPMRLVFRGQNGTPDPDFDDRLTDFSVNDDGGVRRREKVSQVFLAGIDSDRPAVNLAAGDYRVYATRGPEFSLPTADISVKAGQALDLEIDVPERVVNTPGYIAADLHVHSGLSFDNTFSTSERVRSFVAEHGEVMVSSEHDRPTDFAPLIEAMGVQQAITSIAAVEMTSIVSSAFNPNTGGHMNFFPVQPQPLQFRNGMINHENKRLRDIMHAFRERHPDVIAQLNHARLTLALSGEIPSNYKELIENGEYLDHMGVAAYPYNPSQPLHTHPNNSLLEQHPETGVRDIDFDAMEVMNGGGRHYRERIHALRKDWMSFLLQGYRITGTANGDSHKAVQQVALPRTMVAVQGDEIASFNQAEFLAALRAGKAYGTTGPMLDIDLSGVGMGETFSGPQSVLKISLRRADWVSVETLAVQINGQSVKTWQVGAQTEFELPINVNEDSLITVEAEGPASPAYSAIYPDINPYAFSNPIYIDADADGEWQAPGLPQ
ncbi:MAG: CehA/McbA family metallohydrolase [Gammaproteobacteria bacterium]|nr:CehA/McbA family metallohydrolase [Gammaproteobacteria bacterium]